MKTLFFALFCTVVIIDAGAQGYGFAYGAITMRDMNMDVYPKDSTASAVVLREFGQANLITDLNAPDKLIFEHHLVIKILKPEGLDEADYQILLREYKGREEVLLSVRATAYNFENNTIVPTNLETRNVFTDKIEHNRYTLKKFAVPNVKVGSVIEIEYQLESPLFYNLRTWEFQSDIPKIKSEFWATYAANYEYNITLRGYKKLDKNESKVLKTCVGSGSGYGNSPSADCVQLQFGMNDVPAFREEEYMTAKSNFLSAIYFELSVYRGFDGRVQKFTREWKDVDLDMRREGSFGAQIRKGKDVVEADVKRLTAGISDPLEKAKRIYNHIQSTVEWNERFGFWTDAGTKKAYEVKKGNVGDVNLLLVGALQSADLDVAPVLLSTRAHGLPIEIHPELSSFNYVVAQVQIGTQTYLLDATDRFLPFGMLPERCINGKGRAMPPKDSYWIELKPTHKHKQVFVLNLKLERDGALVGTFQNNFTGYAALYMRKKILAQSNRSDYVKELRKDIVGDAEITNYEVTGLEDMEAGLIEKFNIKIQAFDAVGHAPLLFNLFVFGRHESNPFKSAERLYPVDFGAPLEETLILNLDYPEELKVSELPAPVGISLPNGGGRYLQNIQNQNNRISMSSTFVIAKTVFTSAEYHFLKELYSQLVAAQNADIVFERKER